MKYGSATTLLNCTSQTCKCLVLSHDGVFKNQEKIIIMQKCVFTASKYQEITNNYSKVRKTNEFHHKNYVLH